MVTTPTLIKIASVGGVMVCSTGFYLQQRIVDRVRNYDYYKTALKILRINPGAIHLLGEPIKDRRFKLSDTESNFCDGHEARLCVPVSGPKSRGTYYFWAEKTNNEWVITKAELQLKKDSDKRLVIVKEKTANSFISQ